MYTIHHEADTTLLRRRPLKCSARARPSLGNLGFRAGAASCSRAVFRQIRRAKESHAGLCRYTEGSRRIRRSRGLHTETAARHPARQAPRRVTILIDSDILIELTRAKDS